MKSNETLRTEEIPEPFDLTTFWVLFFCCNPISGCYIAYELENSWEKKVPRVPYKDIREDIAGVWNSWTFLCLLLWCQPLGCLYGSFEARKQWKEKYRIVQNIGTTVILDR